tara:strand:- start:5638 stop:6393 length:756 start_codon:yes stop_codon:yes gene_type:complete
MHASEQQVRAVPTPAPRGIWHPIGHARLIDTVEHGLDARGIHIARKRFDLLDDGHKFFAVYDLDGFTDYDIPGTLTFQVGFRGSINQSLAEAIVFGTRVMVCSNGIIAGERILKKKNTTNILSHLLGLITDALDDFEIFRTVQSNQYRRLADFRMTDLTAHDFICKTAMQQREVFNAGDIVKVLEEWHQPSHAEFNDPTAWRLHNAFTEVSKRSFDRNPLTASVRSMRLNTLFVNEFASDLPTVEQIRLAS